MSWVRSCLSRSCRNHLWRSWVRSTLELDTLELDLLHLHLHLLHLLNDIQRSPAKKKETNWKMTSLCNPLVLTPSSTGDSLLEDAPMSSANLKPFLVQLGLRENGYRHAKTSNISSLHQKTLLQ